MTIDSIKDKQAPALRLYKARIYDNMGKGDDRLKVRILPDMADYIGEDLDYLPVYPPFFKGQVVRGWTELNRNPDTDTADLVYVIASEDFSYGYVVGLTNVFGSYNEKMSSSWNYPETKQIVTRNNANISDFDYESIMVDLRNSNDTYIEFHSISTGAKWMLTCYGDMIHIGPNQIVLESRNGSGKDDKAFSQIKLTPSSVSITTDLFEVNAKNTILGHHGMKLVGTLSDSAVSCDGMNLDSISEINV